MLKRQPPWLEPSRDTPPHRLATQQQLSLLRGPSLSADMALQNMPQHQPHVRSRLSSAGGAPSTSGQFRSSSSSGNFLPSSFHTHHSPQDHSHSTTHLEDRAQNAEMGPLQKRLSMVR